MYGFGIICHNDIMISYNVCWNISGDIFTIILPNQPFALELEVKVHEIKNTYFGADFLETTFAAMSVATVIVTSVLGQYICIESAFAQGDNISGV